MNPNRNRNRKTKTDTVRMHPINSFELLFFAVFGQTTTEQTQVDKIKNLATPTQPYWVEYLFKIVFGIYMLVSVVVLINLLIAMMSDTYQRIQVVLLLLMALLIRFLTTYLLKQFSMLDIKYKTYLIYMYYQSILSYLPHKLCMPILFKELLMHSQVSFSYERVLVFKLFWGKYYAGFYKEINRLKIGQFV